MKTTYVIDNNWVFEVPSEGDAERARAARRAGQQQQNEFEERLEQEMETLNAELGPLPADPEYKRARVRETSIPSAAEGKAMAIDLGFDPHVLGIGIVTDDPQERARLDREWSDAYDRRMDEYSRRRRIAEHRLKQRGVTPARVVDCMTLGVVMDRLGIPHRCVGYGEDAIRRAKAT